MRASARRGGLLLMCSVLLTGALCGCSPIAILNAAADSDAYSAVRDVAYGTLPRHRLDIYSPSAPQQGAPTIVFFYGGGWRSGARSQYEFAASALAGAGYTVVVPDYRLYPEVSFPAFVQDGALAVRWVASRAAQGADGAPGIVLMGHSAGAHLAAMLALDQRYLREAGVDVAQIAGLIGLSGPYDFLPINSGYLLDVFPEPGRLSSQPVRFAAADSPPALLIHGTDDKTVDVSNSRSLATALCDAGARSVLLEYAGVDHAITVGALSPALSFMAPTYDDVIGFLGALHSGAQTVSFCARQ